MKFPGASPLFLSITVLLIHACHKPEITPPAPDIPLVILAPPQPIVMDTAFVSASFSGYLLVSDNLDSDAEIASNFFRNGTVEWKCLSKPDQAPPPAIEAPYLATTAVKELKKGEYVFEVTYRTKVGSKSAETHVLVVEDSLANGALVLPMQAWKLENWSVFPGEPNWMYVLYIENRPDLFCYRFGKKINVEIQDTLNNAWKKVETDLSDLVSGEPSNPFFYAEKFKNLTIIYDASHSADATMSRLVTQKTAIRLSF
jgi:hypothetical protein